MNRDKRRRLILIILSMALAVAVAGLYITSGTLDVDADAARDYVAEHHIEDTSAQNAVTAIYLNYRYWDTLFESLILLVSVLAVISLSWSTIHRGKKEDDS